MEGSAIVQEVGSYASRGHGQGNAATWLQGSDSIQEAVEQEGLPAATSGIQEHLQRSRLHHSIQHSGVHLQQYNLHHAQNIGLNY